MARETYGNGKKKKSAKTAAPAGKVRVPSILWIFLLLLVMAASVAGIIFTVGEHYYRTHFMDGTMVNGVNVSGRTAEEVKSRFQGEIEGYSLTVSERTGTGEHTEETITGDQIGMEMVFDDALRQGLLAQTRGGWLKMRGQARTLELGSMVRFDEAAWQMKIDSLKCFAEDFITQPVDAELTDYQSGTGYTIIPEVVGNAPQEDVIRKALLDAVNNLETELDLEKVEGAYLAPSVTADDPALTARKEAMEKYTGITITYVFGENREVLDGDTLHKYVRTDKDGNVTLDTSFVEEYVASLRKKYDTIFRPRTFYTTYGKEVTLEDGDYGWWMNYKKEEEKLTEMLLAGESGERTPEYYQTAAQYGPEDYGNTYVEVNLTAQHLFFYQDGILRLESDFVSGNEKKKNGTPEGVYGITYKERNATLKGENYSSAVSYWMPFNENVGLHDAPWRRQFGQNIYLSSGSHGCVNLPYQVAKELYGMVSAGTPVIVYHLEGTESDSLTEQGSFEFAQAVIDAIDYIGEVQKTEQSEKKIKRARELYDDLNSEERSMVTNYDDLTAAEAAFKTLK